eukprot:CFRG1544T1
MNDAPSSTMNENEGVSRDREGGAEKGGESIADETDGVVGGEVGGEVGNGVDGFNKSEVLEENVGEPVSSSIPDNEMNGDEDAIASDKVVGEGEFGEQYMESISGEGDEMHCGDNADVDRQVHDVAGDMNGHYEENQDQVWLGTMGAHYIEENLAQADNPIDFISGFQAESGLKFDLGSLAVLPFLDVFGVSRSSLHKSLLESLREKLSARIKELAEDDTQTLNTLLEKSFVYFTHPELQDIPINIMQRLNTIPSPILHHISISDEIYEACPIEVKRKVWLHANNAEGQARFRKTVYETLVKFMDDDTILRTSSDFTGLNPFPPKRRRQHLTVKKLVEIIGKSTEIYHMVLKLFETMFKNTKTRLFCTLRSEMLMAFHDADVSEICDEDRCHKLLWCLDACKNDRHIDEGRIKDMQSFFSNSVSSNDHIISDIAMIILDPFTMNTFLCNVFDYLLEQVEVHSLPKNDDRIRYISQLISLGLSAHTIVQNEHYEIPSPDEFMLHNFMPQLVSRMVDDVIRGLEDKMGLEENSKLVSTPLPDLNGNEYAQKLVGLYVLRCINKNYVARLQDLLPSLPIKPNVDASVFSSVVISLLNKMDVEPGNDIRPVVLEGFLIPCTAESVNYHIEVVGLLGHMQESGVAQAKILEYLRLTVEMGAKHDVGADESQRLIKEYQNLMQKLVAGDIAQSSLAFISQFIKVVEEMASKSDEESESDDGEADEEEDGDGETEHAPISPVPKQ